MRARRLRHLVAGPRPAGDRLFWTGLMFPVGNARPEALIPRLARVDAYRLRGSGLPVVRGVQYRAYVSRPGTAWLRAVLSAAGRRYRHMFATEVRHLAFFPGPAVVDIPDPWFSPAEIETLNGPNVKALVLTGERTGKEYERLGLQKPWHVVPQGVDLSALTPERIRSVGERTRRPGRLVVGFASAYLFTAGDRLAEHEQYGVDHLLGLWDEIRSRVPAAELWLLGRASRRLRTRLKGRDDIRVFGWVARPDALAHMANFDVALYPRPVDVGIHAIKIPEYLGAGAPTVAYGHEGIHVLRDGGGLLVDTSREFIEAVVRLLEDRSLRDRLANDALRVGKAYDWDTVARQLETEVLDVYLPA